MLIKHVTKRIKDIFVGEGWDQWARIDIVRSVVLGTTLKLNKGSEKLLINKAKELSK